MTVVSDLDGFFKRVYGKALANLVPEALYIQKMVPLKEAQKIGNSFEFPVMLRAEQGITYAAAGSGAFALNAASSLALQNAVVDGNQIINRGTLDYESAVKATSGGSKAFGSATKLQVKSLNDNTRNRLEIANIYGQSDRGVASTGASVNGSTTTTVVTIDTPDWSPGLWSSQESATIEFREIGDLANLVSSGADAVFVVTSVDIANRALLVTGTTTGITALDTDIAANDQAIFFQGAFLNEHVGLDRIITNVGSLFSIDAAVFSLWRGNTFNAGAAALTFELVNTANSDAVSRGLDSSATVFVSPSSWNSILNDQAALRRYEGSGVKTMENGASSIVFNSQNGTLEFVAHKFVKDGDVFIAPMESVHRIGAMDVSFELPGTPGQIFRHLDNAAGFEFRAYSNQALISEAPNKMTKMTNFT